MENYIVRVYRRDDRDPNKMAGVFESVENETRNTFTSLDNLVALLSPSRLLNARTAPTEDGDKPMPSPATVSD